MLLENMTDMNEAHRSLLDIDPATENINRVLQKQQEGDKKMDGSRNQSPLPQLNSVAKSKHADSVRDETLPGMLLNDSDLAFAF